MIPTLCDYLYHLQHNKQELVRIEKKRAIRLLFSITVLVAGSVLLWIWYK
jgi:hypothetical protein